MSKAILVFDMPDKCMECPCCNCNEYDTYCGMTDMQLKYDFEQHAYVKPDWCPLKPVPEKQIYYTLNDYDNASMDGWNECIDTILGETE